MFSFFVNNFRKRFHSYNIDDGNDSGRCGYADVDADDILRVIMECNSRNHTCHLS